MRNKEQVKKLIDYFRTMEEKELQFEEDAIAEVYQFKNQTQSLAIKVLSIFGGVLAGIAFLGFLLIAGLFDSEVAMLVLGVICIAGGIWLNKKFEKIIFDTASVTFFIIGFILLAFGLDKLNMSENTVSIVFFIIALILLGIVQNYILSFISVIILNGSILTLILSNKVYDLIHIYISSLALAMTYVYLNEAKVISKSTVLFNLYNPIRIGLIFSLLSGLLILSKKGIIPISPDYIWTSSIIIISAILHLLSYLFELLNITKIQYKVSIYSGCVLLLLPTALSPAISGAMLIVMLSFLVNYKTGLTIGIISLIYFISQYYYDLNFTLLTKSILLILSGIFFLGLYLITHKNLQSDGKV